MSETTVTATGASARASSIASRRAGEALTAASIVAGCLALAGRPVAWSSVAVLAIVGATGALTPVDGTPDATPGRSMWIGVTALAVAAFAIARVRLGDAFPAGSGVPLVLASVLAAVAEEAFFRRLVYGFLARYGAAVAIAVSALAFAAVHMPAWGTRSFAVDLAAGVLLGWQRWATGSWTAPAATHAAANLLMIL